MRILTILFFCFSILSAQEFTGVDYEINKGINEKITPGASVLVGNSVGPVYKQHYGGFTYEADAKKVDDNSLYDMASVTKVMATTLCVMKLYDEGKLALDDKVTKYIPEFGANGKDNITLRNLLMHNSGMPAYYTPGDLTDDELIQKIYGVKKVYETGEKMVYSCLHFVTLMKVTEAITGERMYKFYKENITDLLGLKNTMFVPPAEKKNDCLPTENGRQGDVHDPLAFALHGYSGNAGLFSNVDDLSVLSQMMMNGGEYNGTRIYSEETVKLFISHAGDNSTRALGWDTNSNGERSCGPLFSTTSFGHTGYTGTSIWIDPERKIYTIFLTNRVYPDDKASVGGLRIKVHNAVINAVEGNPPAPEITSMYLDADNNLNFTVNTGAHKGQVSVCEVYYNEKIIDRIAGTKNSEKYSIPAEQSGNVVYAVNKTGEKTSITSDRYIASGLDKDILVVDAIDSDASGEKPYENSFAMIGLGFLGEHSFLVTNHTDVAEGRVNPEDYNLVYWVAGEDNSADEIMNEVERNVIKNYIAQGGKLILSGTEVGWAFGRPEKGAELNAFYSDFLGAKFGGDDAGTKQFNYTEDGTVFGYNEENSLYHTGYADFFDAVNGAKMFLMYEKNKGAGLVKHFESGGSLIYLGFPVEILANPEQIKPLMHIFYKELQ